MSMALSSDHRAGVLELLAKVKYAKDDEDEARFASCWTVEARLEISGNGKAMPPVTGRDAIMDFYRDVWAKGGHGDGDTRETHVAEHPDIVARPDGSLIARHAVAFFYADQGKPTLRGYGNFTDEIVLEDGDWRIARRQSCLVRL